MRIEYANVYFVKPQIESSKSSFDNTDSGFAGRNSKRWLGVLLIVVGLLGGIAIWQAMIAQDLRAKNLNLTQKSTNTGQPDSAASPDPQALVAPSGETPEVSRSFSIVYPSQWLINVTNLQNSSTFSKTIATSPNKAATMSIAIDGGERGGVGCTPEATDKPHAAGNACSTLEYLSQTPTGESSYNMSSEKAPVQVVTSRLTSPDGLSKYSINLNVGMVKLNQPTMDRFEHFTVISAYNQTGVQLYAATVTAQGISPAFLTSPEGQAIITSLKTFRISAQ